MKKQFINESFPHMLHGGDYNPDQWLDRPDILAEDMRLMKLAGCNAMTVGIFAWAALEPEEGKFDFSFLDQTINDVYQNGGRIVLSTPSAARPAWLSMKYPEILRTGEDGIRISHGRRANHCYTSPIYREKVATVNRLLAERYAHHPAVIAWHISNEYNGKCYCELCKEAFRLWLRKKYGTLDALNHQWWTSFWAHTYTDWSQIDPPMPHGETSSNGLTLDWKRFVTHQTTDFMKAEIAPLRAANPAIPVTTNMMGTYDGLDYRVLAKELDVISWDSYPKWEDNETDIQKASDTALVHDLNRCFLHKPFMLMESTPSVANWHEYSKLKRPGVHMLSSLQAVAHGSDTVQYFQWRKGRNGIEKYHGAVVDHVGHEHTRVFRDVASVGARLAKLDGIVGTGTVSRVAVIHEWANRWALEAANGFQLRDKKYGKTRNAYYHALWKRGINTDVIGYEDVFSKYDLIIAPMLYLVSDELIAKMEAYVKEGGTILCTYTTGMVNENDLAYLGGFPGGKLQEVFGIWNEAIDSLFPTDVNGVSYRGRTYQAVDYCEIIHARGAEVRGTYTSDFYAGGAAFTVNNYGKGKAYYQAFRDTGDFCDDLIGEILQSLGIRSDFDGPLPYGVTAHSRTDGESVFVFLENYSKTEKKTRTAQQWQTVEDGTPITGEITLAPHETLILQRPC
ncbi:MAG: beta-galactosidase [Ruminococcaceae bacterium]|nr:beta-galactosidase [Oscillospiraceae bacterium]